MTALERAKRSIQKANFTNRKAPLSKRSFLKRRTETLQRRFNWFDRQRLQRRLLKRGMNRQSSTNEPLEIEKVEVRLSTMKLMQTQVLLRISQGRNGRSCTLFEAIGAIKNNDEIMEEHSHDPSDRLMGCMQRLLGRRSHERKYDLMFALQDIEARPSATDDRVSSWEDVEEVLREHLHFQTETTEGEESLSDDPVTRMAQRFELDILAKIDKPLEKAKQLFEQGASLSTMETLDGAHKFISLLSDVDEEKEGGLAAEDLRASEEHLLAEERQAEAQERASELLRELSPEDSERVRQVLYDIGPENDIVAQLDTDVVTRKNMHTLQPGAWLSDEIIHYYLKLLAMCDEELCRADTLRRRSHFFKSFFMTTLSNEGHKDPSICGTYEYKNVKRWSKKVPGKDIFALDKIFFPINVGEVHWVCAVAFMQEKRIQYYDSFGGDGLYYLKLIKRYMEDEHKDKKHAPLPDSDDWKLVACKADTPRQKNGFDCGVFTCMFADFLSKDCPLVFGQEHVNQCRERIALSILEGKAFT